MSVNILPDSRMKPRAKGRLGLVQSAHGMQEPVFCVNCGVLGGWIPAENMTFAYYICPTCAPKHAPVEGTWAMPDEVFWAEVKAAQEAKYGRTLTAGETALALANPDSLESKLAAARAALTPKAG